MLGLGAAQPPPPDASCGAQAAECGERLPREPREGTAEARARPPAPRVAPAARRAGRALVGRGAAARCPRPRTRGGRGDGAAAGAAPAGPGRCRRAGQGRARAGGTSAGQGAGRAGARSTARRAAAAARGSAAGSGVATARRAAAARRAAVGGSAAGSAAAGIGADALTPDEILRLVVLGRSRADAIDLDPAEARRELAAVAAAPPPEPRLDVADATDEELWRLARAEVAIERPPRDDDDDAVSKQLERSWPDLDRFTDLLTKESLKRLEVLGPQFAEPLKTEARWRRKAYESWLRLVDGKGVLPGPAGDLAYGEALFDPNGGLPAEASDEAKAAFVRLREERAELRAARRRRDWEKRALPDK